jgi:heme-degrading monooxygenase HmoA
MTAISHVGLTRCRSGRKLRRYPHEASAMIITVFRSRLRPGVGADYATLSARMAELARAMPGYVSDKDFVAEDGERVTVVEFASEDAQRAWRMDPEHREAQRLARETYYEDYSVQVCEVVRDGRFTRPQPAAAEA